MLLLPSTLSVFVIRFLSFPKFVYFFAHYHTPSSTLIPLFYNTQAQNISFHSFSFLKQYLALFWVILLPFSFLKKEWLMSVFTQYKQVKSRLLKNLPVFGQSWHASSLPNEYQQFCATPKTCGGIITGYCNIRAMTSKCQCKWQRLLQVMSKWGGNWSGRAYTLPQTNSFHC